MKKSNSKQLLTTLDLPPIIPASITTLDFDHAVNSYQPGNYNPEDLPDKIPIINESTGSFRRFIRRAKSTRIKKNNDKRRIVSAPPGTYTGKELPDIPSSMPTTPITIIAPKDRTNRKPLYTNPPRTISLINENIPYPVLTTPNYNPHQIKLVVDEPHLKLEPKLTNDSETNSIGTDSILSTKSIDIPVAIHDDAKVTVTHNCNSSSSDNDSLVDSLFSKEEEQEGDQIDPVTSHEEHEIESSTLVLPKMRKKSSPPPSSSSDKIGHSQTKSSSHQINTKSLGYCLDTPNVYKESRFPLVPSHIKVPKQVNESGGGGGGATHKNIENSKTDKRRSLSDFTHMKHVLTKLDHHDNNSQEVKHRSLISFSQLKLGSKEDINKKTDKESDKRRSWYVDFIPHGNSNRDDAKQQKHRSVSNIVVSKTKQLEPTTFSTTTTTQDKYNRKKRLSYSDFIRPQVRSVSTPDDTRAKKILPPLPPKHDINNNNNYTQLKNVVEPRYYINTYIKPRRNKETNTNINIIPKTSTCNNKNQLYSTTNKPTMGKSLPPLPPPSPPKIHGEYYRTNRFGERSHYV